MPTVGNESDVWNQLIAEIRDWMKTAGYGEAVYMVEAAIDESIAQYAVQIIPTSDTAKHPISGVGLIEVNFEIVVWWRAFFDPVNRATQLIAGEYGAEGFISSLRQVLIQNTLGGQLTIPILFMSGGKFEAVPELDGWLRVSDSYVMHYEIAWNPQ
jgi:hypothetical protein